MAALFDMFFEHTITLKALTVMLSLGLSIAVKPRRNYSANHVRKNSVLERYFPLICLLSLLIGNLSIQTKVLRCVCIEPFSHGISARNILLLVARTCYGVATIILQLVLGTSGNLLALQQASSPSGTQRALCASFLPTWGLVAIEFITLAVEQVQSVRVLNKEERLAVYDQGFPDYQSSVKGSLRTRALLHMIC